MKEKTVVKTIKGIRLIITIIILVLVILLAQKKIDILCALSSLTIGLGIMNIMNAYVELKVKNKILTTLTVLTGIISFAVGIYLFLM